MTDTTEIVTGHGRLASLTRGIVWAFFGIAVLSSIAILTLGFGRILGHPVTLELVADAQLPSGADAGPATILSGTYSTATLQLGDLSPTATAFALVSAVAGVISQVAVPVAIALLAWRLLRRKRVFRRHLSTTVTALGAVLLVAGMLAQGGSGLASGLAAHELNDPAQLHGFWPLAGRFDPTFLGFGVVLMLVGLAFEYAGRLQKDTEGLV